MKNIQLKHTIDKDHEALLYSLPKEQMRFTALPTETFERLKSRTDNYAKPITILLDNEPIGFFVLDYGEDKLELTNNKNSLLIRSLSINPVYQGKGYGKIAMNLVDYFVKEN